MLNYSYFLALKYPYALMLTNNPTPIGTKHILDSSKNISTKHIINITKLNMLSNLYCFLQFTFPFYLNLKEHNTVYKKFRFAPHFIY